MKNTNQLTLEQQFKITIYISKINKLNRKNTKKYLASMLKKMMIKDNIIKYSIKNTIN
uniref:Uncharacterized protein ycf18 n=1 Tax=Polysiphonia scopulorum TaxID=257860 RepID=A0A1Z1MHJ1_9FLOR|nr:phycobilisome degradation protein [Polysiphonia scopulorum]ARW65550.1 phycobilisome degradation protein [Polysiphonia scopulorum]